MTKEPISTKGCRVTAQISLPGRFLVYMPYASKVGVSRKIESREQRAKLREMVSKLLPKDAGGVIVRTVAEGVTEDHFRREIDSLLALWKKINRKKTFVRRAPALLQRETSLTRGIIRDLFSTKVDALHVDSKELYNEIEQYLEPDRPRAASSRVHLYSEPTPLFDKFDIESEIRDLFKARVELPTGGSLIIQPDRGAGQHRREHRPLYGEEGSGEDDPPDQPRGRARDRAPDPPAGHRRDHRLRLHRHGDPVQPRQGAAGAADPSRPGSRAHQGARGFRARSGGDDPPAGAAVALAFDDHRLPDLRRRRGRVFTPEVVARRLERALRRAGHEHRERQLTVRLHPEVALYLLEEEPKLLQTLSKLTGLDLELRDDPMIRLDEFRLMSRPAGRDVTELYAVA